MDEPKAAQQKNRKWRQTISSRMIVGCLLICAGCSDGRVGVSGIVTVDGARISSGAISFQPIDGGTGRGSAATIQNGEFQLTASNGLTPGSYQVIVLASGTTGRMIQHPQQGLVPEYDLIRFRETENLKITVTADGDNRFVIALTRIP